MKYHPIFTFIRQIIKPFNWLIAGQAVANIIWAIDISLRPYLLKLLLNKIPNTTPERAIIDLGVIAGLYLLMVCLVEMMMRLYEWMWLKLKPNLRKHIALSLMARMVEHSYKFYQNQFAGSLANKISDVVNGIPSLIKTFADRFLSNVLALLIGIYTVWHVDSKFAISLVVWSILFVSVSVSFAGKAKKLVVEAAERRSRVAGNIVDTLSNMTNVRLFTGKRIEHSYLEKTLNTSVRADQSRDYFFLKMNFFQGSSFVIFQAVCIYLLILGIQNATLTAGDFALILTLNLSILGCLFGLSRDIHDFVEDLGNVTQGITIILAPFEIKDKTKAKELKVTAGKISFEKVKFSFKGNEPLFENISVIIQPGQKVGLVGYSGSGKSTFVNLILRLFDVTAGCILIDDQDLREVKQESLRRAIAMIPQEPVLFHRTLIENIRYGNVEATDEEVIEAATRAHAHEFITSLQQGYHSLVGERGVKLSGGQRQRIAIARALLKNAPILILDEATSQLDSVTEEIIQESLWKLMQNKTTLVVAHRLSTLLHMDRILVFHKGKIVEDGTHESLLQKRGLYKQLWDAQVGGFLPEKELKSEFA